MSTFDTYIEDNVAGTMKERDYKCPTDLVTIVPPVAGTLKTGGPKSGTRSGAEDADMMVVMAFDTTQVTSKTNRSNPQPGDPCHTLSASAHVPAVVGFDKSRGEMTGQVSGTLRANGAITEGCNDGKADNQCIIFQPSNLIRHGGANPSTEAAPALTAAESWENRPCVYSVGCGAYPASDEELAATLTARKGDPGCVAFPIGHAGNGVRHDDLAPTLTVNKGDPGAVAYGGHMVRRLIPVECERLQGFPDNYTLVDGAKDSPRYKQLGNAVSVPVVEWIARRTKEVVWRT